MRRLVLLAAFAAAVVGVCCDAYGMSIADAKLLPDNSQVSLTGKVVSCAGSGFFYLEEDNRSSGVRVEKQAHGLTAGMRADVAGTINTKTGKERYIAASSAVQNGNGTVVPLSVSNKYIGGDDWFYNPTTGAGQRGASGTSGLNNVGLLVKIWGRFDQMDPTTFTVDDGSGMYIKCTVPQGFFLYSGWEYAAVTGAVGLYKLNSTVFLPVIAVTSVDVLLPTHAISIPGAPAGSLRPALSVPYAYSTSGAACSHGHPVEYSFDWGDGASSPWSTSTSAIHAWDTLGAKTVRVSARCQIAPSVTAISDGTTVEVQTSPCEMIYIPAGTFLMGTPGTGGDENPQHSVYLSGYWIGKYEVTRGEYRQFMDAGGYSNPAYWSSDGWSWKGSRTQPDYWAAQQTWGYPPGPFTQTDNHPVVGLRYYEAEAFCNWAGGHLPTEAQWEKAARWTGSYPNVCPWGDTWDSQKCNNWDDTLYPGYQTAPVGSYPSGASPYGCQDMAGNARELCLDWYYQWYYYEPPPGGWVDPQGPSSGTYRVLHGGSFYTSLSDCRCAARYWFYSPGGSTRFDVGFRLTR